MSHPTPAKPATRRIIETDEILNASKRTISRGAETARFVINRTASLGEALSTLDAAKTFCRDWDANKAHEGR